MCSTLAGPTFERKARWCEITGPGVKSSMHVPGSFRMVSVVHLEEHRRELRSNTDLELIVARKSLRSLIASSKSIVLPPNSEPLPWNQQLQYVIAEWRTRQAARRQGIGQCLCHAPGDWPIIATAQTWRASGYDRGSRSGYKPHSVRRANGRRSGSDCGISASPRRTLR